MATLMRLPMMGQTMEEGTIVKWLKQEGDTVKTGDLLVEVLTDKANMEVEATADGVLRKILVGEGAIVPVQEPIAVIGTADEDISSLLNGSAAPAAPVEAAPAVEAAPPVAGAGAAPTAPMASPADDRLHISPRAKELAIAKGVEPSALAGRGTGPDGSVVERDVLAFLEEQKGKPKLTPVAGKVAAESGLTAGDFEATAGSRITKSDVLGKLQPAAAAVAAPSGMATSIPFTGRRKLTADAVTKSYQTAPHVTLTTEIDATELVALRESVLPVVEKAHGLRISFTDLIVKAIAATLQRYPNVNSQLAGSEILLLPDINIGVAVAIEGALVVPVVRNADRKPLSAVAAELRGLIERARAGKSTPDDLSGGTFSLSNLGAYGVDAFTPILTPGQTGILGVGRIVEKPVVVNKQVEIRSMMVLSLTFDHRVVDGAPAAEFLKALKDTLESPLGMLV